MSRLTNRPLLSHKWQLGTAFVVLTLAATYVYLRFIGWNHPFAKLIGTSKYHVATLGDYVQFKGNPKRFYHLYSAVTLSFDCSRMRDEFVRLTQSIVSPALSTSRETIVWREGTVLKLADPSVGDIEAFATWKNRVVNLATIQHPPEASHYGTLLQALFTSVTIHAVNAGEEFSVQTKKGAFDECG